MSYTFNEIDDALCVVLPNTKMMIDRKIEFHRPSLLKEAAVRLLIDDTIDTTNKSYIVIKEALSDMYKHGYMKPS